MRNPKPQPTDVLIKRLQRVARYFDQLVAELGRDTVNDGYRAGLRARANTCWQSAGRLAEITTNTGAHRIIHDADCEYGDQVVGQEADTGYSGDNEIIQRRSCQSFKEDENDPSICQHCGKDYMRHVELRVTRRALCTCGANQTLASK